MTTLILAALLAIATPIMQYGVYINADPTSNSERRDFIGKKFGPIVGIYRAPTATPTPTGYSVPIRTTPVPHAHRVTAPQVGPTEPASALSEFLKLCEKHGGACVNSPWGKLVDLEKEVAPGHKLTGPPFFEFVCCHEPSLRYRESGK